MPVTSETIRDSEGRLTSGVYAKRQLALVRGQGCRVWDAEGRSYLDFVAGIGTLSLGHCHPAVTEAIQRQAATMVSCTELFYNDARARALEMLNRATPACFSRFFLCNSGTEAVEGAMKFARLATGRAKFVAFDRAFHGRTMGALSATAKKAIRDPFMPLLADVTHVPFNDPVALEAALDDKTAAVLFEPIQGEGGIYDLDTPTAQVLQKARDKGILLICDEIQAGVFRTGRPWGFQHFPVTPDMLCIAKALGSGFPVGAIAIGPRLPELPKGCHGTTYGGGPLGCAVIEAVLNVMIGERLDIRADAMGERFRRGIMALGAPCVVETRGRGLMVGVQLDRDPSAIVKALEDRGLLLLTAGTNTLRMLPPFILSLAEMDEALAILGEVLCAQPEAPGAKAQPATAGAAR